MVIFNSYVKLPEGTAWYSFHGGARCFIPRTTASADAFGSHPLVWQPSEMPQKFAPFVIGGWWAICSMYGIFTNICPKNQPHVGKYTSTMEHMGGGYQDFFQTITTTISTLVHPTVPSAAQVAGYSWLSGVWDLRCWKCSCACAQLLPGQPGFHE